MFLYKVQRKTLPKLTYLINPEFFSRSVFAVNLTYLINLVSFFRSLFAVNLTYRINLE